MLHVGSLVWETTAAIIIPPWCTGWDFFLNMFTKLDEVEKKYEELQKQLHDPHLPSHPQKFQQVAKEESDLRPILETYRLYRQKQKELLENKHLIEKGDEEIRHLAKEEALVLENEISVLSEKLKVLLLPQDPNDEKNIYLEIRAGTGGEEAALFVSNLFRMYQRFAERQKWVVEIASANATGIGGFKEMIALISGEKVYSFLKYESGVHRVQRVPRTEAQGRIHTSAVTVAVLPEAEEVDVDIQDKDLRIDVFRSGGHGGQSVNTTDSAVRITHIPSGLVVICQDEKSQHKNKAKAMKILRTRLYDAKLTAQREAEAKDRKDQIGSGDRSEKIRTYNFPQSRVTDHRIGLTLHQLDSVLDGNLDLVIIPLQSYFQAEALKKQ